MAMQLLPVRVEPAMMNRIVVYAEANDLDRSVAGRRAIEAGMPILEGPGRLFVSLGADIEMAIGLIAKTHDLTPEQAVELALLQTASRIAASAHPPSAGELRVMSGVLSEMADGLDELTEDELEAAPPADEYAEVELDAVPA